MPASEWLVGLFGVEPQVAALGGSYLSIALAFSLSLGLANVFWAAVRGAGDVMTPLYVGLLVNVVNVAGDYALVFGKWGAPALGVRGAAYASGIAMTAGLLLSLWLWLGDKLVLKRQGIAEGVTLALGRRILRIGLPSAAEMLLFNVGIMLFVGINARFGTAAVGAYFIGIRILSFSFIPGIAFQVAASTLVGQNLGAGDPDAATRAGWRSCMAAVAVMSTLGALIALFARPLTGWFDETGARTVELAVHFIGILGAAQPLMAFEFALGGALRGAGDTRFPLLTVMTGLIGARLSLSMLTIALFDAPVQGIWCCLLADYGVKAAMLSARFSRGSWQTTEV
jgi:putative MATE family efflux protein